MRFTLIKDLKQDKSMRPIMSGLLIFTLLYLVVDMFVKYNSFGLFSSAIKLTLFGDEEQFIEPLSRASFLEFIHTEIFFIMMILLTLSAVFARLASKKPSTLWIINATLLSSLVSLTTLGLSYFFGASLLNLYVLTYFLWHFLALYMASHSLWNLNFAKSL